ncbi:MAG: DUF4432 family protein [Kiritimatiellia bacterium]|nr:DUF4432 family protein [Lentisphaerota bacterium]
MQIKSETFRGRRGWRLSNDRMELVVLAGGGHLAGLFLKSRPEINPYWQPGWRGIEPWQYSNRLAGRYGAGLLASISGHNLCLGAFGDPSPAEARAGLSGHGEAPVTRWRAMARHVTNTALRFTYGCELPVARMRVRRTLTLRRDATQVRIRDEVTNLARCDVPFTMCQHVTFGAPFLEPVSTVFDLSGEKAHTFPGNFGQPQRLPEDQPITWPMATDTRGRKIDLRTMGRRRNGDYFAVLMNQRKKLAWFSAMHPAQGLLVAYVWNPRDYPWTGVWEENHSRKTTPWLGRELTRGMEFSNSPFPIGLRRSVALHRFQGQPTYQWLPARERRSFDYALLAEEADPAARGVHDIQAVGQRYQVIFK